MNRFLLAAFLAFAWITALAQTFVDENDSTVITEYNDGKLWVYRQTNDAVVGLTCYEEKDDYGKYYQVNVFIQNLGHSSFTFYPDSISSCLLTKKNKNIELEVYTNEEYQKKIKRSQAWAMALYGFSAGLNAGTAGRSTSYSTSDRKSTRLNSSHRT